MKPYTEAIKIKNGSQFQQSFFSSEITPLSRFTSFTLYSYVSLVTLSQIYIYSSLYVSLYRSYRLLPSNLQFIYHTLTLPALVPSLCTGSTLLFSSNFYVFLSSPVTSPALALFLYLKPTLPSARFVPSTYLDTW